MANLNSRAPAPSPDPQTESSLKFGSAGEANDDSGSFGGFADNANNNSANANVSVTYKVVDLESRFNLNWLMCENEAFKKHAESSLKRLIKRLGHPDEFYDALITFVTGEGETEDPNAASSSTDTPSVNDTPAAAVGEDALQPIPPRQLLSLDELWDIEFDGIEEILTATDEAGAEVEGKKPLLDYLTVWNTAAINFNTADPEILVCWWPDKDKKKTNPQKFNDATRIKATKEVILARLHLEGDENFDVAEEETVTDPNANTETETDTENTDENQTSAEGESEASEWVGKGPLKSHTDIAKLGTLKFIYSEQSGKGPAKARGAAAGATTGSTGELSPGAATLKNWYDAVTFKSRLYKITVTATQGSNPAKIFEAIIFRGQSDAEAGPIVESQVLQWREVSQ
ncbi:MAG: type II secretion system protein GspK [Planctomycetota bacterium]|nr:type II secretion system protein GspK [Planctomycetota bacterium]